MAGSPPWLRCRAGVPKQVPARDRAAPLRGRNRRARSAGSQGRDAGDAAGRTRRHPWSRAFLRRRRSWRKGIGAPRFYRPSTRPRARRSARSSRRRAARPGERRRPAAARRCSATAVVLAAARPGYLVGRSPRSTERCRAQRCPAHRCRQRTVSAAVSRNRRRVITSEWSATSTCGCSRRACGPRDTRSKRRLATMATAASRAGAWTRWYPSREAGLRPRSWTSRALLAKGCLDDSAIPTTVRRTPTGTCGAPSGLCTVRRSWLAAGDTPRPRAGE